MKIAIVSLGCPKNQVDADVLCHALLTAGHTTTADPAEADCILVNTCAFIQSAKEEAIENILEACSYKQQNPALKVVVTGCLAERYKEEIRREMPEVDAVVGMGGNKDIVRVLEQVQQGPVEDSGPKSDMALGGPRVISTPRHYAYLKIAEGCNNHCYYCAIPYIRGRLRSRPLEDCLAEARWLAGEGVKELVVVAQDITAYGDDWGENSICRLMEELNKVEGLVWIRFLYAYPERVTDEFIATMARCEKIVPYLDLPIQHCNDQVLKAMNRKSDRATIESAVRRLRQGIPGITLRTTLIAGFPGETEEQFAEMCEFIKEQQFDRLGCFAYSAEENTVAGRMENQWDEETKRRRADIVMQTQSHIMAAKQAAKVGQVLTVLSDGLDEESGLYLCRTAADAPEIDGCVCVQSDTPLYPGEFYQVKIEDSDDYDLFGVLA